MKPNADQPKTPESKPGAKPDTKDDLKSLPMPELPQERCGTIANVVFPTGIDRRDDLGLPDRFDVYYGMADNRIGAARLDVPEVLPPGRVVDSPQAKV